MPDINDICYIIAVAALLGILFSIIFEDFNYFSADTPIWKLQIAGSAISAMIVALTTIGAIFIKDSWDNRINVGVKIEEYAENDDYGGYDVYMLISARNYSNIDVVLDSFWLTLQYDGKEIYWNIKYKEDKTSGIKYFKDEKGASIEFPCPLESRGKLNITMGDSNTFRDFFRNPETGEYDFPESGCNLIAHFVDQLDNKFISPSFEIC